MSNGRGASPSASVRYTSHPKAAVESKGRTLTDLTSTALTSTLTVGVAGSNQMRHVPAPAIAPIARAMLSRYQEEHEASVRRAFEQMLPIFRKIEAERDAWLAAAHDPDSDGKGSRGLTRNRLAPRKSAGRSDRDDKTEGEVKTEGGTETEVATKMEEEAGMLKGEAKRDGESDENVFHDSLYET